MESSIDLINISKNYYLGNNIVKALKNVTMSFPNKGFWALMGPSGSGKSTLFKISGGIEQPSIGNIFWDNFEISSLKSKDLARLRNNYIGFVFQDFYNLKIFNVFENIEFPLIIKGTPRETRKKLVVEVVKDIGIQDKLYLSVNKLSGGQQQRVAIARALVNKPKVIIADEPTGNLDSKTGKIIIDLLRNETIKNSAFLIVVTHDRRVAEMADKIQYLNDGELENPKEYINIDEIKIS
ncbi:MAG: putative ABC transporter ATP-binding protein [Candidatus Heimdallarchaeota archaeon LC_3]|nr:MAG: putative ABC transporter ATP-binding protein [Candidatus Heimdallarchaeota archaeon LC_3]